MLITKLRVILFFALLYQINFAQSIDGNISCPFGSLPYRVYYPENFSGTTCVIHVSRGGNGLGDDRGQLLSYVDHYVNNGYVVVQVDHRFAGSNIEQIAQFRGEEIKCICENVVDNNLNYGNFQGTIDIENQGYAGHSGGCMEGLEAAGTIMTHGNYYVPQIKAVFGMSPAGYLPDQFGIVNSPSGFSNIQQTAVFVVIGEQEKDVNGAGGFMATDWRLQTYDSMTEVGPRFEAYIMGDNTNHIEISGDNLSIRQFNLDNSKVFFDTYLKNMNQVSQIGTLSIPPNNELVFSTKGLSSLDFNNFGNTFVPEIFPNPSDSYVFINSSITAKIIKVKIINNQGQIVLEKLNFPVDISSFSSGIYFIKIYGDQGQVIIKKIIKK